MSSFPSLLVPGTPRLLIPGAEQAVALHYTWTSDLDMVKQPTGQTVFPTLDLDGSLKPVPHSPCRFPTGQVIGISPGIPPSQTLRLCAVISRDWAQGEGASRCVLSLSSFS